MALELTLGTRFQPGSNLRRSGADLGWFFLLDSLSSPHVLCLGDPSAALTAELRQHARHLTIVSSRRGARDEQVRTGEHGPAGDLRVVPDDADIASWGAPSLALVDPSWLDRCARDSAASVQLRQVLERGGAVYLFPEPQGDAATRALRRVQALGPSERVLQLAPTGAVPPASPVDRPLLTGSSEGAGRTSSEMLVIPTGTRLGGSSLRRRTRKLAKSLVRRPVGALPLDHPRGIAALMRLRSARVEVDDRTRLLSVTTMASQPLVDECDGALVQGPSSPRLPPAYVRNVAAADGHLLEEGHWRMAPLGPYRSQKVTFMRVAGSDADPELVVKVTQARRYNGRLLNERDALQRLDQQSLGAHGILPRLLFSGEHSGLVVLGQSGIGGRPFRSVSDGTPACRHARAMADCLTHLGQETRDASPDANLMAGQALTELLRRFVDVYRPDHRFQQLLEGDIDRLATCAERIPTVFQHGDPGVWNLLITPDDRIGVLDWEAAEPDGMPLWDLFYFLHTYVGWSLKARGVPATPRTFAAGWRRKTVFSELLLGAIETYVRRVGVPEEAILPLFFTCWMHRSLKEATRLRPGAVHSGRYVQLLHALIHDQDALVLHRPGGGR